MNKNIIIVSILIISFILIITSTLMFLSAQQNINQSERMDASEIDLYSTEELKEYILTKPQKSNYGFYIIPISGFIGLFIGFLIYFILYEKIDKKDEKIKTKNKIILELLPDVDKKVINKILEHDGKIRQYELTYIKGLTKVKVHRIIQKLEDKEIIKKEKLGKINNIVLNKDIYNSLKD